MKKAWELENIDDFIKDFNNPEFKLGTLKRISDENQENPDAICVLDGTKRIGLEATIALTVDDKPSNHSKQKTQADYFYNPYEVIEELIRLIKKKSLNDYKAENIDETWLLISGGSYISVHDLEDRLKNETFTSKFNRIFIHKGTGETLVEIMQK